MQTILVPTDFSEASYYAASYACVLAKQLGVPNIVLYHSYKAVITPGESIVYTGDENSLHKVAVDAMIELSASLADQVPPGCDLRYHTDTNSLNEINVVASAENAGMIVMGTTGKGKLEEMVAGSNALTICDASNLPVVLVPSKIHMQPVSSLVFACDLKEIEETLPKEKITQLLDTFHVPVSVLHVIKEEKKMSGDESVETMQLSKWLESYKPVYHEISNDDAAAGILEFAEKMPGSLILLIAKKHGFPSGLFHRSITKQLAFHSTSPLIVLREKEEATVYPVMPLLEI
jgi:nucleotide-binding universal stress UspA family protein